MAFKERFINALFGTPEVSYGAENQAYLNELAKQQAFQDLAQRNNLTTEQALGGVMQGLNYGDKNIAQKQADLGINIPQNAEQVGLANQGKFNTYDTVRRGGLLNDLASGYQENVLKGFNVNNLMPQDKSFATRVGEGLGSLVRFYDKPIGRMAAATGLSVLTDEANPLAEGVKAYVGRQKNVTADKVYRNQLKQLGMSDEELNNIKGNITKEIYEGVTSGMKLGNQRITYGQLALLDDEIAAEVAANPSLANQFVPVNLARDIYVKKRDMSEGKMEKIKAEVDKTKKETEHIGKAKPTVNVVHTHKSESGSSRPTSTGKKTHKTNAF